MIKFFASLAVVALAWLLSAWLLMVTVGVAHAEWVPQLPTVGYPLALLVTALLGCRAVVGGLASALVGMFNEG